MYDPWKKFKLQPWKELFQVAFLTAIAISLIDFILLKLAIGTDLWYLSSSLTGILFTLLSGFAFGALGVYICERWKSAVALNASSLWTLVLCLVVAIFARSFIPIMSLFLRPSQFLIVALIVGVFWQGRFHWR